MNTILKSEANDFVIINYKEKQIISPNQNIYKYENTILHQYIENLMPVLVLLNKWLDWKTRRYKWNIDPIEVFSSKNSIIQKYCYISFNIKVKLH